MPPVTANPLLGPAAAATDPGPARAGGADEEFDVTQHGDRGGPTDQQVMVIGIGIAVALVLLLDLVVFLDLEPPSVPAGGGPGRRHPGRGARPGGPGRVPAA